MRIGIDVRYLSHGLVGGVHTYVKHFIPPLLELASEHQVFLYADTKRAFELESLPAWVKLQRLPWSNVTSSLYHDFFMRKQMERDRLDVVHFPANYGFGPRHTRTVVTLHDALNIQPLSEILVREALRGHVKTARTAAMITYLHYCSRAAAHQSDLILTVSEHARDEIARYGQISRDQIVAIPHAPTPDLRRIEDPAVLGAVRQRHGITRPFVLADALKNPAVLVRAWRLLPEEARQHHEIVFFARRPEVLPIVHEAVSAGHARLLLRPSREDLIALYSAAELFAFPSWIEGFGIPVLEAMTCGAPVVASDRGSIPEVAGDAALLADAEDERTFASHIESIVLNPRLAEHMRQLGFRRSAQFSWEGTAASILRAYERAASASALEAAA